ncbi:creatininase family protein [Anaerosporobacter faecicola]|uniref:creatininase family protein n=1 Tax=Anaerosporobacter faecicola TaxID=2718714 RepID=UPI00143BC38B|nr:creatininase family protein [Anaerosporobacter faecicola]
MGYSIFEDTMVDQSWEEIELAAKANVPVFLPLGVIEEHGPHLPLGTDCYLSYFTCKQLKNAMEKHGQKVMIAPPFYWGINKATSGFPGSFSTRPETMIALLEDIFSNLKSWGFQHVFCFNAHGDYEHIKTAITAIERSRKQLNMNIRFVMEGFVLGRYGLTGEEDSVLPIDLKLPEEMFEEQKTQERGDEETQEEKLDIHAGQIETAEMLKYCPELVDTKTAKTLPSYSLTMEQLRIWNQGGEATRELVPYGYAGNPAEYGQINDIDEVDQLLCEAGVKAIMGSIGKE